MTATKHAIWAIVPAAGIGKRMQSTIPKQYLPLNNHLVIEHTINALLQNQNISGLVVALQPDDAYWRQLKIRSQKPVITTDGGKERANSVLNAINALFNFSQFELNTDWVMVHDAVRPCLRQQDINKLVTDVAQDENGGLLALQVRDTMKRQQKDASSISVEKTINRDNLWHALTPQYFPALQLKNALTQALQDNLTITDESSAMEFAGYSPRLIQGHEDNIKITRPDDLALASVFLQSHKKAENN